MTAPITQTWSLIMPTIWMFGTEVETINDLLEHTSRECNVRFIHEKQIQVVATEIITAGVPGPLWAWIELSPFLSISSAALWAAIGGGGGALVPTTPLIVAPTGVTGTVHTFFLPWAIHSSYCRLVCQTPVSATPLTSYWVIQAYIEGQGP